MFNTKSLNIFYKTFIFINFLVILTKCSVIKREISDDLNEAMTSHLELLEMDYADRCSNLSKAKRKTLMGDRDSYENEYQALLAYGDFAHHESLEMRETYSGNNAGDLTTRWIALENNPDALLTQEDYKKFAKLEIDVQKSVYSVKVSCKNIPCDKLPCEILENNCVRRRPYLINILRNSRDPAVLKSTYNAAMKPLEQFGDDWVSNLQFAENETRSNWERLSGCTPDDEAWLCGYSLVEELWSEIEPFYQKLVKFVHSRLKQIFPLPENSELLPIEYLGTLNIAKDGFLGAAKNIVPHRQLIDELQAGLDTLDQDELQVLSENLVKSLGLNEHIGTKVIKNCLRCFDPAGELLSYCQSGIIELLVPNKTDKIDILSFLTRQENVMKANLLKCLSDTSLESYRLALEQNILWEAMVNLGSTMLIQRLPLTGNLVPEEILLTSNSQNTALLLGALKILPKLAYFRTLDKFRIDFLKSVEFPIKKSEFEKEWSTVIMNDLNIKIQNTSFDLLVEPKVVKNRPYLSQFLGIILHFELLQSAKSNRFQEDFKKIARENIWPAANWQNALKNHFDIERLTTEPLLEYFHPLEEYIEQTELIKQVITPLFPRTTTTTTQVPTTTKKSLDEEEKQTEKTQKVTDKPKETNDINKTVKIKNVQKDRTETKSKEDNLNHSHMGAIIGALIGLFVLTVIVVIILKKKYVNRRRSPKNNRNGNR